MLRVDERGLWGSVALHPEGVDRNIHMLDVVHGRRLSPSTRRAWIEIRYRGDRCPDRGSPSTRRAWIEICAASVADMSITAVALHPEGVDRNLFLRQLRADRDGRPPPGGRG